MIILSDPVDYFALFTIRQTSRTHCQGTLSQQESHADAGDILRFVTLGTTAERSGIELEINYTQNSAGGVGCLCGVYPCVK